MEDAFPPIVTRQEFDRIARMLQSRAPKKVHPRRAVSPYLLSGLLKCETSGEAMTAAEAKSGRYTYYIAIPCSSGAREPATPPGSTPGPSRG